jgi:hypothetical protein
VLRPRIRSDARVEPWYAQNILLYMARPAYDRLVRLHTYRPIEEPGETLAVGIWWNLAGRMQWPGPLSLLKILLSRSLRPIR